MTVLLRWDSPLVDSVPDHPQEWDNLTREQLIALLLVARGNELDVAWTHRASDDFPGCTE